MKKLLVLACCLASSVCVFAEPSTAPELEAELSDDNILEQCGLLHSEFQRSGTFENQVLSIGLFDFPLKASYPQDPQYTERNYQTNVYKGIGGTVYIKRYPEGTVISESFENRPKRSCDEITVLPVDYIVSRECKFDDKSSKSYAVTKMVVDSYSPPYYVYEFTFVPSNGSTLP